MAKRKGVVWHLPGPDGLSLCRTVGNVSLPRCTPRRLCRWCLRAWVHDRPFFARNYGLGISLLMRPSDSRQLELPDVHSEADEKRRAAACRATN